LHAANNGKLLHYISESGQVVQYTHSLSLLPVAGAYFGASYSPFLARVYFSPYKQVQATNKYLHYLDLTTGHLAMFSTNTPALSCLMIRRYSRGAFSKRDKSTFIKNYAHSKTKIGHGGFTYTQVCHAESEFAIRKVLRPKNCLQILKCVCFLIFV
jgi:hypothetical protein